MNDQDASKTLDFWRCVEHLEPPSIPDVYKANARLQHEATFDLGPKEELPWQAGPVEVPARRALRFRCYVGIFPVSEVQRALARWYGEDEREERKAPPARAHTALAALVTDHAGRLIEGSLEAATFPWVLGELEPRTQRIPPLESFDQFRAKALAALGDDPGVLKMEHFRKLGDAVCKAAKWAPANFGPLKVRIQTFWVEVRNQVVYEPGSDFRQSYLAEDLEKVSRAALAGDTSRALQDYLNGTAAAERQDVVRNTAAAEGLLRPTQMPPACWPSPGKHPLVYAQQLAVNAVRNSLAPRRGLLAVNGPPGTGKTTLIRDIVVDIVTRRAEKMCTLPSPAAAFVEHVVGRQRLYDVDAVLLGDEIVIASSNNAAVENITRELPQRSAVDAGCLAENTFDYFTPLASRMLRESSDEPADAWALLTAVLGNSTNRKAFERAFWRIGDSSNGDSHDGMEAILKGLSGAYDVMAAKDAWDRARRTFDEANAEVKRLIEHSLRIEDRLRALAEQQRAAAEARARLDLAQLDLHAKQQHKATLQARLDELEKAGRRLAAGLSAMQAAMQHTERTRHQRELHGLVAARHEEDAQSAARMAQVEAQLQGLAQTLEEHAADLAATLAEKPSWIVQLFSPKARREWLESRFTIQARVAERRDARDKLRQEAATLSTRKAQIAACLGELSLELEQLEEQLARLGKERDSCIGEAEEKQFCLPQQTDWNSLTDDDVDSLSDFAQARSAETTEVQRQLTDASAASETAEACNNACTKAARDTEAALEETLGVIAQAREDLGDNLPDEQFWQQEDTARQLTAPWMSSRLHDARRRLFLAALQVQKAFVLSARRPLLANVTQLMAELRSSGRRVDAALLPSLWTSLFLMVPVISTTFASVGRLFAGLTAESLGWLIIDEAGQSTPQAAVGALWRCQRAVVVGDPMQVEPICSIGGETMDKLCEHLGIHDPHNPARASAQLLADRATFLGTALERVDRVDWIGLPLRVHRRCEDPMFTVANYVAYDNLMVRPQSLGREPFDAVLGDSAWFHLAGKTYGNHWVEEQGRCVAEMVMQICNSVATAPNVVVVTPFKAVAQEMKALLKRRLPRTPALNTWIEKAVGTIHVFQGQEADNVIFLLGGSQERASSVRWASAKPNLLNVAITRARHRLYVVGDRGLWGDAHHFDILRLKLPLADAVRLQAFLPASPAPGLVRGQIAPHPQHPPDLSSPVV